MPKLGFSDTLFFIGTALTIVLLVLDKAGKLKGPLLLVLLALAAAMMLPVVIGNAWVQDAATTQLKISRGLLTVSLVGFIYSLLAVWISTAEAPPEQHETSAVLIPTTKPELAETPSLDAGLIIEPSYSLNLMGLPIPHPPYSTLSLLVVHENSTAAIENIVNSSGLQTAWPTSEPITPPESVGVVTLANHGTVGVYNVSYSVVLSIGAQRDPGGVKKTSVALPLVDLPVGGPAKSFYLINESSLGVLVELPRRAVVSVQGEKARRTIDLRPRSLTFFDSIPLLSVSFHKWQNGKIINPDMWKTKNKNRKQKAP